MRLIVPSNQKDCANAMIDVIKRPRSVCTYGEKELLLAASIVSKGLQFWAKHVRITWHNTASMPAVFVYSLLNDAFV
eukprot:scaffold383905_cov38-Prasinocladus_malaysianus.AAC.2